MNYLESPAAVRFPSLVKQAAREFARADYAEALKLYARAASVLGERHFAANISLCVRRLASTAGASCPAHEAGGSQPEREQADLQRNELSMQERSLIALAKSYQQVDRPGKAAYLGRMAYNSNRQPALAKWLAFRLFDSGQLEEPLALLESVADKAHFSESETKRFSEIKVLAKLLRQPPTIPNKAALSYEPIAGSLLYVAASCLPYHNSGYTNRTHELNVALKATSGKVTIVTRPGYPWDRPDREGLPSGLSTAYEGLEYRHIRTPSSTLPLDTYLEEGARAVAKIAREQEVSAIHAASNHVNALPALLAARQLGLPFAYEMRGLWDMSRAAKVPEYENSDRYRLGIQLEALVAREADHVFVISQALGEYITKEWGIDPAKIELLPNCVNPETMERAKKMAGPKPDVFTVGYAGSLLEYEGLDLLIDALAELKKRGTIIHARIIGEGPERKKLEQRAKAAGLNGNIQFLGRLTPDEARARLAETHAAVLPRRPSAVCQMVTPLKLVEARSLGLPLIFSDLPLLATEVSGYDKTELFSAGDASSMAACLSTIAGSPGLSDSAPLPAGRLWRQHAASLLSAAHAPYSAGATGRPAPKVTNRGGAGFSDILTIKLASEGPEAAAVYAISREDADESFTAAELLLEQGHVVQSVAVGEAVVERQDALHVLRRGARLFHRAVDVPKALALARRLAIVSSNPSDVRLVKEIMQTGQLHRAASEPPAAPAREPHPRKIINFLAFSLPYKTVGYATRSQGLARGIKNAGWDIVPYTRPGFPRDLAAGAPAGEIAEADSVEGITYRRIEEPLRRGRTENDYMTEAVAACAEAIRRENPAVVHAASNYVTALPALIAARRAGLPFVYEVRGFWEITRTSRDEEFSNTPKFRTMKLFESVLTSAADHIITLTSGMREEMVGQGVPAEKISIAYNGVDADLFQPRPRDEKLAAELRIGPETNVIGYVGSLIDYEGLDDLLTAAAELKKTGKDFKLLMVGDGSAAPSLRQLAVTLEIQDRVIFTGRVPREQVAAYYSLIDIAPFPRKPWNVCELVSPLKPFEAMALEKLVVASDTKGLAESINDGNNGLLFRKGDVGSLTTTLAKAFDRGLRDSIGTLARQWAIEHRTWDSAGRVCGDVYSRLLAPRMAFAH